MRKYHRDRQTWEERMSRKRLAEQVENTAPPKKQIVVEITTTYTARQLVRIEAGSVEEAQRLLDESTPDLEIDNIEKAEKDDGSTFMALDEIDPEFHDNLQAIAVTEGCIIWREE